MVKDQLLIVPREACLPYYRAWFEQRGLPIPADPNLSIFVASKTRGPLAGVGVYVSDGPYYFLENLASDPTAPKKLVHRAILVLAEQARILGAILGKHPLLSANSTGLVRTLSRGGFQYSRSVPMYGIPVVEIREAKKERDGHQSKSVERAPKGKGGGRRKIPASMHDAEEAVQVRLGEQGEESGLFTDSDTESLRRQLSLLNVRGKHEESAVDAVVQRGAGKGRKGGRRKVKNGASGGGEVPRVDDGSGE